MTRHRMKLALAGVALIATTGAGCDAGAFILATDVTQAPVHLKVDVAQLATVAGVAVEVTGPGIDQPIIANLPIADGSAEGQIRVLAGSDRAFTIRAYDARSVETHRGGDTLDISADATQSLNVALAPLVGDVNVGATAGSYHITVSLPAASIAAGETLQADVTVVDANGETVEGALVTWGSSNPSVASVATTGTIEGLVAGEATIGAAFQGFGGSATLTVQ